MVTVLIPWRETPGRAEHLTRVLEFYAAHFPSWPVRFGDSGHDPFHRAATRNLLVREHPDDVVILNDADTIAPAEDIATAVTLARAGGLIYPFTRCAKMVDGVQIGRGYRATGGIYVTTPETWWTIGGQDEHFTGWGGEDDATYIAAETLSTVRRTRGLALQYDHPARRREACPAWADSARRMDKYRELRGNTVGMLDWFEQGRPVEEPCTSTSSDTTRAGNAQPH